MLGHIALKLITATHYHIHVTVMSFSRSWV